MTCDGRIPGPGGAPNKPNLAGQASGENALRRHYKQIKQSQFARTQMIDKDFSQIGLCEKWLDTPL